MRWLNEVTHLMIHKALTMDLNTEPLGIAIDGRLLDL
jgi:hypothetical protein